MCPGNGTIQCALGMGLSNVPLEWDNPMCPGKELANVPWEWDESMCTGNETIQGALGKRLANLHW